MMLRPELCVHKNRTLSGVAVLVIKIYQLQVEFVGCDCIKYAAIVGQFFYIFMTVYLGFQRKKTEGLSTTVYEQMRIHSSIY